MKNVMHLDAPLQITDIFSKLNIASNLWKLLLHFRHSFGITCFEVLLGI